MIFAASSKRNTSICVARCRRTRKKPASAVAAARYCNRKMDGSTKTCRQNGALRVYENRKQQNPVMREYKRSYKSHNARIRYGLMTRDDFAAWSQEARDRRDKCVNGDLSLDDFVEWLDSDNVRKTLR